VVLCDEVQIVDDVHGEKCCAREYGRAGQVVQKCSLCLIPHAWRQHLLPKHLPLDLLNMHTAVDTRRGRIKAHVHTRERSTSSFRGH